MAHKTKRAPFPTVVIKDRVECMRAAIADETLSAEQKREYVTALKEILVSMIDQNVDHWLSEIDRIHQ